MNKEEVCNKALARMSDRKYLEGSEQARVCDLFFEDVVREVLMAARWGFATRRERLWCEDCAARVEGGVGESPAGGRMFRLPEDCLRLLEVGGGGDFSLVEDRGLALAEPREWVDVDYITDEYACGCHSCFPDTEVLFLNAVTVLLASRICMAVTGDSGLAASLGAEYRQIALPDAMTINKYQDSSNDLHPLRRILDRGLFRNRGRGRRGR